jgi:hypothetical protein
MSFMPPYLPTDLQLMKVGFMSVFLILVMYLQKTFHKSPFFIFTITYVAETVMTPVLQVKELGV